MESKLVSFFNKRPRIGVLATANREGEVNAAYFGSPTMLDEQTVMMGLGENRTLQNLQENPKAVFIIVEPAESMPEWKGLRLYLKMQSCERDGARLDQIRSRIAAAAGEAAGRMIAAAVTFQVSDVRPLVDRGQGWNKSI